MGVEQLLGLEREDGQVVLGVYTQQLLSAELQDLDRGAARGQRQHNLDSLLAKDVDLAGAELALAGADGYERLDGVVCDLGDFGVDAIVADLHVLLALAPVGLLARAGTAG
ncbi:hypothetical protein IG631_01212 [Alternaria alternata]|nr:hypothetical protein IG631_01212 [Alternaria alternata]